MSDFIAVALVIGAYVLGSLCSAIFVCQALGLPDPRTEGSHNPGATNVMRIGGKKAALLTLVGDMLKGVPLVLLAQYLQLRPELVAIVGFAAFLGHLYPVFFKFEGGKGVATALGVVLALHWPVGLAVVGAWLTVFSIFRISSLSSLLAFAVAPVLVWYFVPAYMGGIIAMSALLMFRHKANIKALLKGEERKFGEKKN